MARVIWIENLLTESGMWVIYDSANRYCAKVRARRICPPTLKQGQKHKFFRSDKSAQEFIATLN